MEINDKYLSHLLANPYHMKKKKINNNIFTIDHELLMLLNKKFNYELMEDNIPLLFEKIEKILFEIHRLNIIHDIVNNLVDNTIKEVINE